MHQISNGEALRNQKYALDVKLEISSTVQVFEKQELEENPCIDENLTNIIRQEHKVLLKVKMKTIIN